jgi:LmbE family N-acetylglucosaminyl deacetylase
MTALESAPPLGTVLAVWAHPDDESFVARGLVAAASAAGSTVVCLTATRGEEGTASPDRWPDTRLARTRTHEMAAAQAVLGIAEHRFLPFRDGACDRIGHGAGMAAVARVIDEVRPDTIVTFGPDGITGHPDHRAVSRWTSNAWAAVRPSARLLWATLTAGAARRMAEVEHHAGAFYPGYPLVADDREVALHLELRGDELDRKVAAMRAHATQTATVAQQLGEAAFRSWWRSESYVDVGAGRSVLAPTTAADGGSTIGSVAVARAPAEHGGHPDDDVVRPRLPDHPGGAREDRRRHLRHPLGAGGARPAPVRLPELGGHPR